MNHPSREFEAAVAALCDGTAGEAQQRELAELLRKNPEARDDYLLAVELHARLASDDHLFVPSALVEVRKRVGHDFIWRVPFWLKAAAAFAIAGAVMLAWLISSYHVPGQVSSGFARIVTQAGAEFSGGWPGGKVGSSTLGREALTLTQGTIMVETEREVTLVIEAPAEFRFESAQRLALKRGKAMASVPAHAKGFTIVTPSGEVVDLGTQFGVDVPEKGAPEVHVFKGEVLAQAGGATEKRSVKAEQAVALQSGEAHSRELRSAAFIQRRELDQLATGLRGRVHHRQVLTAWQDDPAWLAALDLDTVKDGQFRWAQGRWPGSRAVEFTQPGDFLPVEFSGTTNELTLAAWVRLDQVPRAINSLLHTNGWGQPGQVHWMVAENQRMRFAIFDVRCVDQSRNRYPESNRLVTAATGRWTHLAAVYSADRRTVRFYIDGAFDNEVAVLTGIPAVLGPARVGNWNRQERILSGRLDELLLLKRALSDEEIRALFEAGNPYS